MSKSPIPSLLSPEQTDIFTQLIRDNPISFQNEISEIKRNFPNLGDVSAFSILSGFEISLNSHEIFCILNFGWGLRL